MKKQPNQELAIKDFPILQIGDWVSDRNGFPVVVVSLAKDWCNCDFEGNEGDVWEFNTENPCYHIPLSRKIIDANGDMLHDCKISICCCEGAYYVYDQFRDAPATIGICTTVDELQRMLRTNGYTKVAEEFNPIIL